jgi:hypothetical protein
MEEEAEAPLLGRITNERNLLGGSFVFGISSGRSGPPLHGSAFLIASLADLLLSG